MLQMRQYRSTNSPVGQELKGICRRRKTKLHCSTAASVGASCFSFLSIPSVFTFIQLKHHTYWIPFFIGLQFQIKRIRPRLVGSLFILGRISMLLFGWFPQMRNRDSVLNALNGHSDHGRIEIKNILPKISFTLSLQMRSNLLLLSQRYTFRFGDMVQQMKIY